MKSNGLGKIVYAILAAAVMCSVTVGDMLILLPEGAHAQKVPQAEIAYVGSDGNLWLTHADGTNRRRLTTHGLVKALAWAPDGSRLAYVRSSDPYAGSLSDIMVIDLDSGSEFLVASGVSYYWLSGLAWSPDGRSLAFGTWTGAVRTQPPYNEHAIVQLVLDSGATTVLARRSVHGAGVGIPWEAPGIAWSPTGDIVVWYDYASSLFMISIVGKTPSVIWRGSGENPSWSPDGSHLAWYGAKGEIVIAEPTGSVLRSYRRAEEPGHSCLAWSPQGDVLALGGAGGLWLLDLEHEGFRQLVEEDVWDPEWSPDGSQLAFTYTTGLGKERWLAETAGVAVVDVARQQIRLLDSDGRMPAWRPAPTGLGRIAFISERDGKREIYNMKADGSELTRLTYNGAIGWLLSWSPDGGWIAFDSHRHGNGEIYKMRADGSEVTRLTDNEATDSLPTWSPDGQWIAFVSNRDGNDEIYKMRADGSEVTRLTFNEGFDCCPTWSPDSRWIAFEYVGDGNIYKMKADGSELTCLTPDEAFEAWPSWSPDGEWIAFRSNRGGNSEIYKMKADGSEVARLSFNELYIGAQSWSPDGQWIAFESDRGWGRNLDIYKMRADGSEVTRLTFDEAYDGRPAWGPIPRIDLSDLIEEKQPSVEFLSGVGYNEQPSQELLERLEARGDAEPLSLSDISALQRLVLTEELLTGLYPHYAQASADTGEALTSFVLILFGLVKALRMVEARLPDSPFTRPAKALIARIIEKLIDLINRGFEFLEYRIVPSQLRPTFHNLRQLLWAYAKAHIMGPEDPFGPGGEALMKLISDPELGISRDNILLSGYRGRTQSLIDKAVLTADPDYTGADPLNVHPTDEGAKLQMEGVVNQLEIWSDYHHTTYEDLKKAANIPALAADVADIASLTGVLAPLAQVVARAADLMELLITGYGGSKSWQFLECIEQSAQDGQARIYDPSMRLEIPPACEKARKLGLFAPSRSLGTYAWPSVQPLARLEQESEEYQQLLQQVIAALESEDRETLADLVPQLLDADEELSEALDLATIPILATADDETSEQLFSQGVSFDLDIILLYAHLADALLVPEEASFTQAQDQAHIVAASLDRYQQLIATIQLAPTEPKPAPILLISSISIPEEITVDREFTLGVEVANVGAVAASEATLLVNTDEGIEPRETTSSLGDLEAESTSAVTFRLTPRQEGTSLITLILSSQDGSSVSRLALVEVEEGKGWPPVTAPTPTLWPWLAGLGLLALILVSVLGWGVRRRKVIAAEAIVKLCPNCGTSNVAAAKYCIKCGKPLGR